MLDALLLLWVTVYISTIVKPAILWLRAANCAMKLSDFVNAFVNCDTSSECNPERYAKELNAVLRYYPVISDYFASPALSYADNGLTTCCNAKKLLDKFKMEINFRRRAFMRSLNPFVSAKQIVLFPVTSIHWMGFKPGKVASLIINAGGWLITYLLGLYSAEIKALLSSILQQLIKT